MTSATGIQKVKRSVKSDQQFTILIPSWNNLPYLELCIKSIRQNSHFNHQLVIHINEGKDGTADWVKAQADIDYTYSEENIGICYALNISSSIADTDYILFMNDDMYACPGWDTALLNEIKSIGHKFFFLSATMIEPVTQNPCCIEMNAGSDINSFDEKKLLQAFSLQPMKDWQGATWPPNVVHKDIWNLAGGYSIEFSPGMNSDPDFSMKLWTLGIRLFKGVGDSRVYHFGSKTVSRIKKNKGYYTFIAKWGLTQSAFVLRFLKRGEVFSGPLQEPGITTGLKIKNIFKQMKAAFYR
jgi:glycosyltransferase involved in cell wall biosynthesis